VLKIDPGTDSTSTFGDFSGAAAKWLGAVLSPNGHIYGLPSTATSVLKIDPYTDSATTFGDIAVGDYKWWGGVLAPNGAIYAPSRFFAQCTLTLTFFAPSNLSIFSPVQHTKF
jgi:hypothetical protein